jgi:hypothetical protein
VSEETKQAEEPEAAEPGAEEEAKPAAPSGEEAIGDDRPFFARAYPRDRTLDELIVAFERGNYAKVRTDARALADRTKDAAVKGAAEDLLRRIQPDSLSTALVVVGIGLLLFLAYSYLGHAPHEGAP